MGWGRRKGKEKGTGGGSDRKGWDVMGWGRGKGRGAERRGRWNGMGKGGGGGGGMGWGGEGKRDGLVEIGGKKEGFGGR